MAAPANEFQKAVYEILQANVALSALVGDRIYDRVARDGDMLPLVTFGPSDEIDADADCIDMADHSLQIDCWSEYQGGFREVKEIAGAVKAALHLQTAGLDTHALVEMRVVRVRVFRDADGLTSRGVVELEAMIEAR